jgi:RimJ/RimL family protein N-acetyltransferase
MNLRTVQLPRNRAVAEGDITDLWLPTREEFGFAYQLRAQSDVYPWFGDPTLWTQEKMFGELEKYLTCSTDTLLMIRHSRSKQLVGFLGWRDPEEENAAITVGRLAVDKPAIKRLLKMGAISIVEARRIAQDAAAAALDFLFNEGGIRLARAHAYPENSPSRAVIEQLGFRASERSSTEANAHVLFFELTIDRWSQRHLQ